MSLDFHLEDERAMKERPILFSGGMVRAILDGSKTQTRRVAKEFNEMPSLDGILKRFPDIDVPVQKGCPYGTPGDRLWVRETWAVQHEYDAFPPSAIGSSARWHYAATEDLGGLRKRPSIFLPRRGSRILLEITDVRVQRLQEISEDDARAEGVSDGGCLSCGDSEPCGCSNPQPDARDGFAWLWQSIHGSDGWHANPWVWAITFRRLEP
jgi:hypothetical protein